MRVCGVKWGEGGCLGLTYLDTSMNHIALRGDGVDGLRGGFGLSWGSLGTKGGEREREADKREGGNGKWEREREGEKKEREWEVGKRGRGGREQVLLTTCLHVNIQSSPHTLCQA
jgi:hypothetical protein